MLYTMLSIKVISLNNLLVSYLNYSCVNNDKHDLFHYNIHYKVTHTKKQTNKQTNKQTKKQTKTAEYATNCAIYEKPWVNFKDKKIWEI